MEALVGNSEEIVPASKQLSTSITVPSKKFIPG